jgi:type II secretory pathway component PulJ
MKKSIVLLELIFSIVLFSVVSIVSLNIILELYVKNETTYFQTTSLLKLETTRLYITKNNDFSKLVQMNDYLTYDGYLLLDNISKYNQTILDEIATINICIDKDNICQTWKIKL